MAKDAVRPAASSDALGRARTLGHRVSRAMTGLPPVRRDIPPLPDPTRGETVRRVALGIPGIDDEELDTEFMIDLHNYLLRAVQAGDDQAILELIGAVERHDPERVDEVRQMARELTLVHRERLRRLPKESERTPEPRPIDRLAGASKEDRTRLGWEIEVGARVKIRSEENFPLVESLINETLAATDLLEFVIDDLLEKERLVQVEFRTLPIDKERLQQKGTNLNATIKKQIAAFPFGDLSKGRATALKKLETAGWRVVHPRLVDLLRSFVTGVGATTRLQAKSPQHVTHSLPLDGFLKLGGEGRELLIPGTGAADNIVDLLLIFFRKIDLQVKGGTIVVTTEGRNRNAPNVKTALDTLAGLLSPEEARAFGEKIGGKMPESVRVAKESGKIGAIETFETLPEFPKFNPQKGRGFLAAEEKLKAPLFDVKRRDVRVLVEHRGEDELIKAVKEALGGKPEKLEVFVKIFDRLDKVKGDGIFERWFQ